MENLGKRSSTAGDDGWFSQPFQWLDRVGRIMPRKYAEAFITAGFAFLVCFLAFKGFMYAFAAVLALFASLWMLRRPIVLVYAVFVMIPVGWINLLGDRLRVITFLALIALGYYCLQKVVLREDEPFEPIYAAFGAYLLFCFLSLINSSDVSFSITGMKYYLFSLAFGFTLIQAVKTPDHLRTVAAILLGWGVFQALLALAQSIVSPSFFPAYHFHVFSMDIVNSYAVGAIRRASGTFESGPRLAMFLLLPLALSLTFYFKNFLGRNALWMMLLGVIALGLFVSFTRISIILAPTFLLMYYFFERENQRVWRTAFTIFIMVGIVLILVQFAIPEDVYKAMGVRFGQEGDQVYLDRFYFLYNALMAFTEHPIIGWGVRTYTLHSWEFMQRYPVPWRGLSWDVSPLAMPENVPVHNDYGRMLAETGVFSLIAFVVIAALAIKNLRYAAKRAADPLVQSLAIAFTLFLAVMIVYWFFHEYIMEEPFVSVLPFAFSVVLRRMADQNPVGKDHDAIPA